ncbi:MAG: glycoside hydrolase family 15 protein [Deltaproteobacteria bacterium]|nr:MAG: glycoside hydrolase family 15 protein [Deltaproteobacteria bacterium]
MSHLDLAVIGNCSFSALIDPRGRVEWSCLPRFDSDPVFCSLLAGPSEGCEAGFYEVAMDGFARSEQGYLRNTAILVTRLYDDDGGCVELTDFAPRFQKFGRFFRPVMLVRHVRPVSGDPRIRIRLRPAHDYGAARPRITHGSNHIRYVMPELTLRLTTDTPVSYVLDEVPFLLERPTNLILGPDESLTGSVNGTAREFFEQTRSYWADFTRGLAIPFEWQEAVIRAAITLKLCSFEETGAILAAATTSIPEAPDTGRNWDYRYCWLRDSYFVVDSLNRLGATVTMENYLGYLANVVASAEDGHLQPVYGITLERSLPEREVPQLAGYRGMGPVRVGNEAYQHLQNDVYGSVVLAATQAFFDQRLLHPGSDKLFDALERVGAQAVKLFDKPDAGIWELRSRARVHTFSSVMCWAACDRLARIGERLRKTERALHWRGEANRIRDVILKRAWSETRKSFVESFEGSELDASLLMLQFLGFISPSDPRFEKTVAAIEKELRRGQYIFRYAAEDDFGLPQNAFNICTFWYIDALHAMGRREEARELFENMLACRTSLGLLSEHLDPTTREPWGNFPQTYSMVGLILCAMRLSESWERAF